MSFKPISISEYIKKYQKNNPNDDGEALRNRLKIALSDYNNGVKCNCGNDIWVIGSASVGNQCFTCITGESQPNADFEIESALMKKGMSKNINDIKDGKINGFFDDDGNEINMDIIPKPSLCISCKNNDNPKEEVFCNMTRYDQKDEQEFKCFAYKNVGE
jgi:hypothetical protein